MFSNFTKKHYYKHITFTISHSTIIPGGGKYHLRGQTLWCQGWMYANLSKW